jgi:hypothetical protein
MYMQIPGLARVVDYLFTHDPKREQLRYMEISDEHGHQTYGALRRRLCGAAALGYWSAAENRTLLNPKDADPVRPGDQLLVLCKHTPKFTAEAAIDGTLVCAFINGSSPSVVHVAC